MTEVEIANFLQRGIKLNEQIKVQYIRFNSWKEIDSATTKEAKNHIETLKAELLKNMTELKGIEAEITRFICESDLTDLEKNILELRYLGYKRWQEIGDKVGYSDKHLLKKHREIIHKLEYQKVDT